MPAKSVGVLTAPGFHVEISMPWRVLPCLKILVRHCRRHSKWHREGITDPAEGAESFENAFRGMRPLACAKERFPGVQEAASAREQRCGYSHPAPHVEALAAIQACLHRTQAECRVSETRGDEVATSKGEVALGADHYARNNGRHPENGPDVTRLRQPVPG